MAKDAMNEERVRNLIEAYGADPARWPVAERALAEVLLAATPSLRDAQAEARRLDTMLDRMPMPDLPAGLLESVLVSAAAIEHGAEGAVRRRGLGIILDSLHALWPKGPAWAPASVLAAAAALGMMVGVNLNNGVLSEDGLFATSTDQVAFVLPDDQDLGNL